MRNSLLCLALSFSIFAALPVQVVAQEDAAVEKVLTEFIGSLQQEDLAAYQKLFPDYDGYIKDLRTLLRDSSKKHLLFANAEDRKLWAAAYSWRLVYQYMKNASYGFQRDLQWRDLQPKENTIVRAADEINEMGVNVSRFTARTVLSRPADAPQYVLETRLSFSPSGVLYDIEVLNLSGGNERALVAVETTPAQRGIDRRTLQPDRSAKKELVEEVYTGRAGADSLTLTMTYVMEEERRSFGKAFYKTAGQQAAVELVLQEIYPVAHFSEATETRNWCFIYNEHAVWGFLLSAEAVPLGALKLYR